MRELLGRHTNKMIVDCRLSSLGAVIEKTQSLTAALLLEAFFVISVANILTVRSKLHCLFPSPMEAGVPVKVA